MAEGHATTSVTLSIYSHDFDSARNVDAMRTALEGQFSRMASASS